MASKRSRADFDDSDATTPKAAASAAPAPSATSSHAANGTAAAAAAAAAGNDDDDIDLDALLNSAEPVEALDLMGLKKLVLALERKINANRLARFKFAGQPERFMESEVELDQDVQRLQQLATAPELYAEFVRLGAVPSLVGLLEHENTDIAADAVSVIHEMLEPDNFAADDADVLLDAFLASPLISHLLTLFGKFDEAQEEDRATVHNIFAVFESLAELRPAFSADASANTALLDVLLARLKAKSVATAAEENRAFASEVLAILLQSSPETRRIFGQVKGGIETLLTLVAPYKKKDLPNDTEEEYVENLFNALCSCLLDNDNKQAFVTAEGLELMLIMVKAKKFSRRPALRVIDYALTRSPAACARFVDSFGLKTLFSALMHAHKKTAKGHDAPDTEHIVSALWAVLSQSEGQALQRILYKFVENDMEKLDRLIEWHQLYHAKVVAAGAAFDEKAGGQSGNYDDDDDEDDEQRYLARLDAGLYTLQINDLVLAFVGAHVNECGQRVAQLLGQKGISLDTLAEVLSEYAHHVGDDDTQHRSEAQRVSAYVAALRTNSGLKE